MEVVQLVLSRPELVEKILEMVDVPDLVNCALVSWTWNKEAVKILNQKAMVELDFDDHKISSYLEMIRKGGRCHDQLALDCLGETDQHDLFGDGRQEITNEQFQVILSAMEIFGPSKIKKLKAKLEFGNGGRTPEEFQPIFTAAQNVESLTIEYELKNGFSAASTLSCFPDGVSFGSLKAVWVRFSSTNNNESRIVISKLIGISPNLTEISGMDEIMGIFLDEMGDIPGRLEKIVKIETRLDVGTKEILLRAQLPNLKILDLEFFNCDEVVPVLEKCKDTLVELRFSLLYYLVGELTFPKSMARLQKIHLLFLYVGSDNEKEKASQYPILKFPTGREFSDSDDEDDSDDYDKDGGDFYPNLNKFEMEGISQRGVLSKYLAIAFPGSYRSHRSKSRNLLRKDWWNDSKFPSVRILHLSSQCEDWSDILDDECTRRRLMYYFPNADFGSAEMVHSSSEESDSHSSESPDSSYSDSDSDDE